MKFTAAIFSVHALLLIAGTLDLNLYSQPTLITRYLDLFGSAHQWKIFRTVTPCKSPSLRIEGVAPESYYTQPLRLDRESFLLANGLTARKPIFLKNFIKRSCGSSEQAFLVSLNCGETAISTREIKCS